MAQPGTTKIPVGTVLAGKYRITREIGRGGMASVYEAENVDIGKRVAIKVLAQELTTSAVVVERFLREARAAASIRSPYICDVYDSGRLDDNRPFLVLELLEGESLFERLTVIPYLDVETTVALMTQVCRGLTKAHAANIVHRDLKPENIFLTRNEDGNLLAKILDFGLAKFYAPLTGPENKAQARLTREGAVFGTPAYMSPEQVRGQGAVDHRADLWALGCITYECLTGKTVWKTEQGVAMTFAQIASAVLPNPNDFRRELPASFGAWFSRALDRDLEKRFQTAREFSDALAAAFGARTSAPEADRMGRSVPPPSMNVPEPMRITPPPPTGFNAGALRDAEEARVASAEPPGQQRFGRHSFESSPTVINPMPQGSPSMNEGSSVPPAAPTGMIVPPAAPSFGASPVVPPATPSFGPPPFPVGGAPGAPAGYMAGARAPHGGGGGPGAANARGRNLALETVVSKSRKKNNSNTGALIAAGVIVLLLVGGGVYFVGKRFLQPEPVVPPPASAGAQTKDAPTAATATPTATATADVEVPPIPSWVPMVADAQKTLADGDLRGAYKQFKEAFEKGGHGVPRTMMEHVQIGMISAANKAPCSLTGLARPRTFNLTTPGSGKTPGFPGGPPSIAVGPRGAVIAWTDGHTGNEHVFTALLDSALRVVSEPVDVTPEGMSVSRPELLAAGDKLVLTYWEGRGSDTGVHARLLDATGSVAGAPVVVGASKVRGGWATVSRIKDGSFFVAWTNETELGSEDLFLTHLSPTLELQGDPVRATDFIPVGAAKPRVRYPSIAVHGDILHIGFRLEREPSRLAYHMRLPVADASKGLSSEQTGSRVDRVVGEMVPMNMDKSKAEAPSIACGGDACFLLWHAELQGGVFGALIEPTKTPPAWRKKFSKGSRPSVAFAPSGGGQAVWYDGGRVVIAPPTRDGVGAPTKIARVISDQPAPSIVAGTTPGEWYVAWLDYETGHLEPYAARVQCR